MAKEETGHSIHQRALLRILRPIVRYWIRSSQTLHTFVDLLKIVFVEIAVEEMQKAGSKINVSRISVMSGVHRTDVTKIYKKEESVVRSVGDVVSRVIGQWEHNPEFTTKYGKPRVITCGTDDSEFVELVRCVSKSVSPGSVLFELERSGSIERTKRGIALVRATHKVTGDVDRSSEIVSKDIQSLLTAVQENLESASETSPNLHIRTEYDNVYVADLPAIRDWLRVEGKKYHKKVRDYLSRFDKDINEKPAPAGAHVVLTAFSLIREPEVSEEEAELEGAQAS